MILLGVLFPLLGIYILVVSDRSWGDVAAAVLFALHWDNRFVCRTLLLENCSSTSGLWKMTPSAQRQYSRTTASLLSALPRLSHMPGVRMTTMKRHIGKLIAALGVLMIYPLSGVVAPLITRLFFCQKMPDGEIVILNINAGFNGYLVCLAIGSILLLAGIIIEVSVAFKNRKNANPNNASLGIVANAPNREG